MRLLIVGRLQGELVAATRIAMERGARVAQADGLREALTHLRARGADLVLADIALPIGELVAALGEERIATPVIACGRADDPAAAAAAIRAGARDFLPLPPDAALIAAVLAAIAEDRSDVVVRDEAMEKLVALATQVARSDASVLVSGESGTGKEMIARLVHARSKRADRPFISVNCAAIPDNLLESELFGHEKGAFTGAAARRIGKFEEADGGTLLLDEISEMDVRLQAKLLRALQERVIDRVGGGRPVPVDIRVIATSNRRLAEEVRKGSFREDLYYRLNVVHLRLPPLRERPRDVVALAEHFARRYAALNGVPERPLSLEAKRALIAHPWRGNVRELENTIHRAVLIAPGPSIGPDDIVAPGDEAPVADEKVRRAAASAEAATRALVGRTVAEVERDLILDTLDHCLGNRTHAARILGISIRTLRNKLSDYVACGVAVPAPGEARISVAGG
jgi:DNA-binding NtrC family response regulator